MDSLTAGYLGMAIFVILLFMGVQVVFALGISGTVGLILIMGLERTMSIVATSLVTYSSMYSLVVIPLFICMGLLALEVGASRDAFDAFAKWGARVKGSLGLATVGGITLFGAMTGSSIAAAVVFAKAVVPEMIRHGYDKNISYGLVAAGGGIGMLIPPSILAIIYGVLTEQSIGLLLIAGIGPGLVYAFSLAAGFIILVIIKPSIAPDLKERFSWADKLKALPKLWPFALVIAIVIGGIYSGVFTVNEAAGVGNAVLILMCVGKFRFTKRLFNLLKTALLETAVLTTTIFTIVAFANIFTRFLTISGVARSMTNYLINLNLETTLFVVGAALLFIVLGCFIDSISIMNITVPLFLPVLAALDINAVWFGIVLITATQVGLITPPVGMNLFAVKGIAGDDTSLSDIIKGAFPFLICCLVGLALIVLFPSISFFFPSLLN